MSNWTGCGERTCSTRPPVKTRRVAASSREIFSPYLEFGLLALVPSALAAGLLCLFLCANLVNAFVHKRKSKPYCSDALTPEAHLGVLNLLSINSYDLLTNILHFYHQRIVQKFWGENGGRVALSTQKINLKHILQRGKSDLNRLQLEDIHKFVHYKSRAHLSTLPYLFLCFVALRDVLGPQCCLVFARLTFCLI